MTVQAALANFAVEDRDHPGAWHAFAVRTVLRDGREDVGHRHDPGTQREVLGSVVKRIAAAIEPFVMERRRNVWYV